MHLSINFDGYPFCMRVSLIDWNSQWMVEYELQMAYEHCNRMLTRFRLYLKEEKLENLVKRLVLVGTNFDASVVLLMNCVIQFLW